MRATTKSFLEFCYTPDKAVEVTLQPIRRFGFDAAIIFSDILVMPDALGQKVWFEEGEGPKLEALTDPAQFGQLSRARLPEHLAPVYEAIRRTRAELPTDTALLGLRRRALHARLLHDRRQRQQGLRQGEELGLRPSRIASSC